MFSSTLWRRIVPSVLTVASFVKGQQLQTLVGYKGSDPQSCDQLPTVASSFDLADSTVNIFFVLTGMNPSGGDKVQIYWINPQGSNPWVTTWNLTANNGYATRCFFVNFDIATYISLNWGLWQAQVYVNGQSIGSPLAIEVDATPRTSQQTIFLVHGIGQHGSDMAGLGAALSGVDPSRFRIDSSFDFGDCAAGVVFCSSTCTIEAGASSLAKYIDNANPVGDVILIGYSMGGLLARDVIVNQRSKHHVGVLITLGTPNLGYPYIPIDDVKQCYNLEGEMFGDFRNSASSSPVLPNIASPPADFTDSAGNTVSLSRYLNSLNNAWKYADPKILPRDWLAASGEFCPNDTRVLAIPSRGCTDYTQGDGVVCDQSARILLNLTNPPTRRWADPLGQYAHTTGLGLFCDNSDSVYYPLYSPPREGDLVRAVRETISGSGRAPTANLSIVVDPNPIPMDPNDSTWYYTVTIQEMNGVGVNLNGLFISENDYSDQISDWFGSSRIEAYGQLTAYLYSWNYDAPTTIILDVSGDDDNGNHMLDWPVSIRLNPAFGQSTRYESSREGRQRRHMTGQRLPHRQVPQ